MTDTTTTATVETTTQNVETDIKATKKRAARLDVKSFVQKWQKAKTLEAFCQETGLAATTATQRASSMRGKFRKATIKRNADGTPVLVDNGKGEMVPDKGNGVLKKLTAAKEEIDFAALAIEGMDWLTEESDEATAEATAADDAPEANDGGAEVAEAIVRDSADDDSEGWGDE